jgi:dTDP-4-amino-4,6-dideoxygalactose transaminase
MAKLYTERLSSIDWCVPQLVRQNNLCSYYAYIVKLIEKTPFSRDELIKAFADNGVMTSVLYHPVHLHPLYLKWFNNKPPKLPVAESLGRTTFALPLYNGITADDIEYVMDVFDSLLG